MTALCSPRRLRRGQIVEYGAVGAVVAVTMLSEIAQCAQHCAHFLHPPFEVGDVRFGEAFHLARRAFAIAPKREQGAHFFQREAEIARAANELQYGDVCIAIVAIAIVAPRRRLKQLDALIVADHLGRDA